MSKMYKLNQDFYYNSSIDDSHSKLKLNNNPQSESEFQLTVTQKVLFKCWVHEVSYQKVCFAK